MDESYTPLPKQCAPDKRIDKSIKTSFYNSDFWKKYEATYSYDDIGYGYYGQHGNSFAVKMNVNVEPVYLMTWEEKVDDITIYYTNSRQILIFVIE